MRLKEDRRFQNDNRCSVTPQLLDALLELIEHPRVDDLIELLEVLGIAEDDTTKLPPVHRLVRLKNVSPKRLDDLVPHALMRQVGLVADFVGVDNHRAKIAKHARDG